MTPRKLLPRFLPLASLFVASAVHAHPGHPHPFDEVDEFDSPAADFAQAAWHPFTGLDHLAAALAVGCLAYVLGRRMGALASALFMGSLALGWALASLGAALPMLEQGLALSVLAAGVVVLFHQKCHAILRLAVLAFIGVWNGGANGMEMAASLPAALGLMTGTGQLVAAGAGLAALASQLSPAVVRYAGATAAVVGAVLTLQRIG